MRRVSLMFGAARRRERYGPRPLEEVLAALVQESGWSQALGRRAALVAWPQVVGPILAGQTVPLRVQGDILWVAVRNSAWATQLALLRSEILHRLRTEHGSALRDIVFRVLDPLPRQPWAPGRPGRAAEGTAPPLSVRTPAQDVFAAFAAWRAAAARRDAGKAAAATPGGPIPGG